MKPTTTTEMTLTIYNDSGDVVAVVCEDADGLDCVQVKEAGYLDYDQAKATADAIVKVAEFIRQRRGQP
jgi:hypothetical protein